MKGITAYLYHHVANGEKKILEDVGEARALQEQYHRVGGRGFGSRSQGRS